MAPTGPKPPSTAWYRVAGGALVLGLVLALGWFLHALTVQTNAVNELTAVPWARDVVVEVAEPGVHTLWAGPGCSGGCRPESAATYRRHLTVAFADEDGRAAPVSRAGEQYYNVGSGREARAVWWIDFPHPGTYAVELGTDEEVPRPALLLGEGRGLPVRALRGSLFLTGGGVALAAAIVVVTWALRRRAYDRLPPALAPSHEVHR